MINFQSRCRGAARKSRHDWRVETADNREHTGRGFCKCAVHRILLTSLAAPCHAAASSRGSCAVPAVWRAGASLELGPLELGIWIGPQCHLFSPYVFPIRKKKRKMFATHSLLVVCKFHHQSPAASSTATAMTPSPGWWRKVDNRREPPAQLHSSPSRAPRRSGGRAVRGPRRHVSGPPFFGWRIAFLFIIMI